MSSADFAAYFLSHHAYALRNAATPTLVYGGFYIKPNFPGRCAHICNGGFLVAAERRGLGAARFMGAVFPWLAKQLGYRVSRARVVDGADHGFAEGLGSAIV